MSDFDTEAIRAQVRTIDFARGTPSQVAMWREDMADSRANLAIEDMVLTSNEDALFNMLLSEGVPPSPRVANPAPAARSSRRRSRPADYTDGRGLLIAFMFWASGWLRLCSQSCFFPVSL